MKPQTWRRRRHLSDLDLDRALHASYRHALPSQADVDDELERIVARAAKIQRSEPNQPKAQAQPEIRRERPDLITSIGLAILLTGGGVAIALDKDWSLFTAIQLAAIAFSLLVQFLAFRRCGVVYERHKSGWADPDSDPSCAAQADPSTLDR